MNKGLLERILVAMGNWVQYDTMGHENEEHPT